jgi:hypothetical protein
MTLTVFSKYTKYASRQLGQVLPKTFHFTKKSMIDGMNALSLDLNFLSGILDPRITFARADLTSCATYFNSAGLLTTAAANIPRFEYNPNVPAGTYTTEYVPNGTFANATDWALGAGITISGGTLNFTAVASGTPASSATTAAAAGMQLGRTYKLTVDATITSGSYHFWTAGAAALTYVTTNGTITVYYLCSNLAQPVIQVQAMAANSTATFDNISIKEVYFTPQGLLLEEGRTNLLLQSRDSTNVAWTKVDIAAPARNQLGIDGVANTAMYIAEGVALTGALRQSATIVAASTVTFSAIFKRTGAQAWFRMRVWDGTTVGADAWFDILNGVKGAATALGTATVVSSRITALGNGAYRCSVTATLTGSALTTCQVEVSSALANSSAVRVASANYYMDYAQLEVGGFPTAPIATTTAAVGRVDDSAIMSGVNFTSWFTGGSNGTIFMSHTIDLGFNANRNYGWAIDDGGLNRLAYRAANTSGGIGVCIIGNGVSVPVINTTAPTLTSINNVALTYTSTDASAAVNGAITGTMATGYVPIAETQITFGSIGNNLNGHIRRFSYYTVRLTDSTIQSLTL